MRYERDYIERTIATVRNHREADNCWPQWANIFADEIKACWAELSAAREATQRHYEVSAEAIRRGEQMEERNEKLREALREIVRRHEEPCGVHEAPLPDDVALAEVWAIARAALSEGEE